MSFLQVEGKNFVVFGLANKKSVACVIAKNLVAAGARVIHVVRSEERKKTALKLFPGSDVFTCDVEEEKNIISVRNQIAGLLASEDNAKLAGIVHSIAFANYSEGFKPFHETKVEDFLQAANISCFSFISIANHFKEMMERNGSMVTISISTTRMAAENYGYMAPIKAALDSSLCFLAKSFSAFSSIRFNAVGPGLLKTSASAGIPGYVDSYLYAETAIPRKRALSTQEAADAAVYLLSERSSGINGQTIVVDAGMSFNYFDKELIKGIS